MTEKTRSMEEIQKEANQFKQTIENNVSLATALKNKEVDNEILDKHIDFLRICLDLFEKKIEKTPTEKNFKMLESKIDLSNENLKNELETFKKLSEEKIERSMNHQKVKNLEKSLANKEKEIFELKQIIEGNRSKAESSSLKFIKELEACKTKNQFLEEKIMKLAETFVLHGNKNENTPVQRLECRVDKMENSLKGVVEELDVLKSRVEYLEVSIENKDDELSKEKQINDNLTNRLKKHESRFNILENEIRALRNNLEICEEMLKNSALKENSISPEKDSPKANEDLNPNENESANSVDSNVYKWIVDLEKIKSSRQVSRFFCLSPALFLMRSEYNGEKLNVWLNIYHPTKSTTKLKEIKSILKGYEVEIYLEGPNDRQHKKKELFENEKLRFGRDMTARKDRGYLQWIPFLTTSKINEWSIDGKLHIFCKIKQNT